MMIITARAVEALVKGTHLDLARRTDANFLFVIVLAVELLAIHGFEFLTWHGQNVVCTACYLGLLRAHL